MPDRPRPPWLERQKRSVRLSRAAIQHIEAAATHLGVGFSVALDGFIREAMPTNPKDTAQAIACRLDGDSQDMARWEELSDDVAGP